MFNNDFIGNLLESPTIEVTGKCLVNCFFDSRCICDVGSLTGSVVLFPIAGLICEYGLDGKGFDGGWPAIFYIFGKLLVDVSDVVTLGGAYTTDAELLQLVNEVA